MYISVNSRQVRMCVHGSVSFPKKRLTFRYPVRMKIEFAIGPERWHVLRSASAGCLCRQTPVRLIVLQDERSNIFYYVQLGTWDFMVILGSLMLLRMQRFSPLPHYVDSSAPPSGLFFYFFLESKNKWEKKSTKHLFHLRFYYVLFPQKFAFVVVCTWNTPVLHRVYPKLTQEPGDRAKVGGDNSHR